MKKIGFTEEEITEKHLSYFRLQAAEASPGDPKAAESLAKMRYENYESRRRHKMKVIYKFLLENQTDFDKVTYD